jgi:hypothetical protein
MRIFHWIVGLIERVVVGAVIGIVTLISRLLDATIGLVGRIAERMDAKLARLARESDARHERQGRRKIDPITLE